MDIAQPSRNEKILLSIINKTPYDEPLESRIEELLFQLKAVIEAGGNESTGIPFTEADKAKLDSLTNPTVSCKRSADTPIIRI